MYNVVYNRVRNSRLYLIVFCFGVSLSILLARLIYIQLIVSDNLKEIACKQHKIAYELQPKRGTIYDRNSRVLVADFSAPSVYAVSKKIEDKVKVAKTLAPILNKNDEFLLERLRREKYFVWLARKTSQEVASIISNLKIEGIEVIDEPKRFYPNGSLAAHLLGFTDIDNRGLEGIELFYDDFLKGSPGWMLGRTDGKRREIPLLVSKTIPSRDGFNLVLTIDEVIQYITEKEIERAYQDSHAKSAVIIVMDPNNGDILALSCRPTYNPNAPQKSSLECLRNRAVSDMFEPGSSFKIVAACAALTEHAVEINDKFYCEDGTYRISTHTLHDWKPYGWLTFREIIVNSSNIGVAKVAQKLGANGLYRYISAFGFGVPTGIDLPGEIGGMARPPERWSKISIAVIPMGQEVAVTPIQLACAISTIANGGVLMKPRIVKEIKDNHGEIIRAFSPTSVRRVLPEATAERIKEILVGVVEEGTGKQASIPGYKVAGKTGTAQKVDPSGRYSHSRFTASFLGFAPAYDPAISVVVVLDEPQPYYYGGQVAALVFQRVADQTLRYVKGMTNRSLTARIESR